MKNCLTRLLFAFLLIGCSVENPATETAKAQSASHSELAASSTTADAVTSTEDLSIKIRQGMPYLEARKILLGAGWQIVTAHSTPNGTPVCFKVLESEDESLSDSEVCNYKEIDNCSGSGMGYCMMSFFDGNETYLSVRTAGGEPPDAEIDSWRKYKREDHESAIEQNGSPENQSGNAEKLCEQLLGAGIYNGILEDVCEFNGGVKMKILSAYDQGGCRNTLPQATVDQVSKDVLTDTKKRYQAMGHVAFCNGNIDSYNALK